MNCVPKPSSALLWRLQIANHEFDLLEAEVRRIKNHEHDLLEAAARRTFDLADAAARATDAADRCRLIADARTGMGEVCDLAAKIWKRIADERGLTLLAFVASCPAAQGIVANLDRVLSNLEGLEREMA